jgi:hypothetical protein
MEASMKEFLGALFAILVVVGICYIFVDPSTMGPRPFDNLGMVFLGLLSIVGVVGMAQILE